MKIYIDADACVREIREVVYRASERTGVKVEVVANSQIRVPLTKRVEFVLVEYGEDKADEYITEKVEPGVIVISGDVALAWHVVARGAIVINMRGRVIDENNVGERLATRNLMMKLRDRGEVRGGPKAFKKKDKGRFADALDRELVKRLRGRSGGQQPKRDGTADAR